MHTRAFHPYHRWEIELILKPVHGDDGLSYLDVIFNTTMETYRRYIMIENWQRLNDPYKFTLKTYGDRQGEKILFPEHGISLSQEKINFHEYKFKRERLPGRLREAAYKWSLHDDDMISFKDFWPDNLLFIKDPNVIGLNFKLRVGAALSSDEQDIYDSLIELTQADLPRARGSYLHVAEYVYSHNPWFEKIFVGDIITNYPQFMLVSSDHNSARDSLRQATKLNQETGRHMRQLIIFRIDNASKCTPVSFTNSSWLPPLSDYLYPPRSYFVVKGISYAIAEMENHIFPNERHSIILEEASEIPVSAKNLYNGELYIYDEKDPS
ncbi:hypothetical protein ABK905_05075 [Acerihabitans sp. KWT182]|uniref:Uncharacterized protein n=1 Tax=Acerihabitans sp. KWT182 TaxID=3157919 RepID=A0AAU7QC04_9GAMM